MVKQGWMALVVQVVTWSILELLKMMVGGFLLQRVFQASTDLPGLLHQIANLVISISKEWEETW
jgi:hypothetical protein